MKQSIQLKVLNIKNKHSDLKYHIKTFGCQMNQSDSERIAGILESDGMTRVNKYEDADLLYINTCTIRDNADQKLYGTLGELKRWKDSDKNRRLIVGGCASQKDKDLVRERAPWVDVVLGTNNIGNLLDLIHHADTISPITEIYTDFDNSIDNTIPINKSNVTGMVTIQIGCNNSCSFCIVPSVRGSEKSRRPLDIYEDVNRMSQDGVKEVLLLGQNVNSYGRDLKIENKHSPYFIELLMILKDIEGIERIRFISPHPKDVNQNLVDAISDNYKLCNHIHLPLQSGSNKVLFDMKRGYNQKKYMNKVEMIKDAKTDISITTDIIVGFPGETSEDFDETLDIVKRVNFDSVFMYKFSSRPGTEAAKMSDKFLEPEIIDKRFNELKKIQTLISEASLKRFVGTSQIVLVEGLSKKNDLKSTGRTDGNIIVILDKIYKEGTMQSCFIFDNTPFILYGKVH